MSDTALIQLDVAQHALAECKTVMEAKQIADVAEAARVYLERTNASVETVNRAAEIRTLAERQMGSFLKEMPKNVGGDPVPHRNRVDEPATLAEIGITKKQSATAQKLASIPEEEFRERVAVVKASGESPVPSKILAFEKKPEPTKMNRCIPDRGFFIARGAVAALKMIQREDGERRAALIMVRDFCSNEIEKDDK